MWKFNGGYPNPAAGPVEQWTGIVDAPIAYSYPETILSPVAQYYLLEVRFNAAAWPFSDPPGQWQSYDIVLGLDHLTLRTEGRYQWAPVSWGSIPLVVHGAEIESERYALRPYPYDEVSDFREQYRQLIEYSIIPDGFAGSGNFSRWHPSLWRLSLDNDHWKVINLPDDDVTEGNFIYHLAYPDTISPNAIVPVDQDECPRRFFQTIGGNVFYFTYFDLEGDLSQPDNPWRLPLALSPFNP